MSDMFFDAFVFDLINTKLGEIIDKTSDDEIFDEFIGNSIFKNKLMNENEEKIKENEEEIEELTKENKDLQDLIVSHYNTTPQNLKRDSEHLGWVRFLESNSKLDYLKELNNEYNKLKSEFKNEVKEFKKDSKYILDMLDNKLKIPSYCGSRKEAAFEYSKDRCDYDKDYYYDSEDDYENY